MAIFQYPFAEDGDRNTDLPNAASPTGLVSFKEGFTPIYETLPSLGGQYIQRRDFNEIMHRICEGVNTLETLIPTATAGVKILADLATAIGDDFQAGTIYYALNNKNEYLLTDTTSVSATDTITDLITAGKVENITPLGQGQTWHNMAGERLNNTLYTNTGGRAMLVIFQWYPTPNFDLARSVEINGARVALFGKDGSAHSFSAVLGPGDTIKAVNAANAGAPGIWWELR